jgi:hypothetical protein
MYIGTKESLFVERTIRGGLCGEGDECEEGTATDDVACEFDHMGLLTGYSRYGGLQEW